MMVGFIEAVPIEIEKAALIDGCSVPGVLVRIIVPLTAQGIAATGILAFIASWNIRASPSTNVSIASPSGSDGSGTGSASSIAMS